MNVQPTSKRQIRADALRQAGWERVNTGLRTWRHPDKPTRSVSMAAAEAITRKKDNGEL
jgi:hypothetical protein